MSNVTPKDKPTSPAGMPRNSGRAHGLIAFACGTVKWINIVVWSVLALVLLMFGPFLRFVAGAYLVFQFLRMLYYWDTPGMYAGWTFLAHYGALQLLFWYTHGYVPRGLNLDPARAGSKARSSPGKR